MAEKKLRIKEINFDIWSSFLKFYRVINLLLFCLVCSREIVTTPAGFKTKGAKIVFCGISQTNKAEVDHNKI